MLDVGNDDAGLEVTFELGGNAMLNFGNPYTTVITSLFEMLEFLTLFIRASITCLPAVGRG